MATKMKKVAIICMLCCIGTVSFAQDYYSGGYGSLQLRYGEANGQGYIWLGGYGGWLIGGKLLLGAGGAGAFGEIEITSNGNVDKYEIGYSGFVSEYRLSLSPKWKLVPGFLIGGGRLEKELEEGLRLSSGFFVAEPHLQAELEILPWMHMTSGIFYRHIGKHNLPNVTDDYSLNGLSYGIGIKLGYFQ
jgi:hypothetical protein